MDYSQFHCGSLFTFAYTMTCSRFSKINSFPDCFIPSNALFKMDACEDYLPWNNKLPFPVAGLMALKHSSSVEQDAQ